MQGNRTNLMFASVALLAAAASWPAWLLAAAPETAAASIDLAAAVRRPISRPARRSIIIGLLAAPPPLSAAHSTSSAGPAGWALLRGVAGLRGTRCRPDASRGAFASAQRSFWRSSARLFFVAAAGAYRSRALLRRRHARGSPLRSRIWFLLAPLALGPAAVYDAGLSPDGDGPGRSPAARTC